MEMSREGVAGWPGGPVPDRTWMEMSASISSMEYQVACTVSALRRSACTLDWPPICVKCKQLRAAVHQRGAQLLAASTAAACSRCRKHPNADPLANARLASPGGLPGAAPPSGRRAEGCGGNTGKSCSNSAFVCPLLGGLHRGTMPMKQWACTLSAVCIKRKQRLEALSLHALSPRAA